MNGKTQLHAGIGRCDITPAPGTPQGGWGAQTHERGLGADMPMYATALVLASESEPLAIVDIDSIGFDAEWTAKVRDAIADLTGLPRDRIRVSCSHTHSGPNTFRLDNISEGLDMVVSYLDALPLRVASAVWSACKSLRPVRCAAAAGKCEISVNRRFKTPDGGMAVGRNWNGIADPTVGVLRFDDLDGTPVATIVHYSCHPTTMAWENKLFTPDYPGECRRTVETEVGGTCLFLQGTAGNITTRRGFTGDTRVYHWLGKMLGLEAAKVSLGIEALPRVEKFLGVLQSGAAIALYDDVPEEPDPVVLRMVARVIKLPLKQFDPPDPLEAEVATRQAELAHARTADNDCEIQAATARLTQSEMRAKAARLYYDRQYLDWEMQGIRIGNTALLSMQGEPFVEIGLRLSSESPFPHTFVSGYSNGAFGYIPTREAFAEGGYEATVGTLFSSDAADVVVKEGLDILRALADSDSK
jgi:hypothetical protein